jgi:hypothetical protein
MLLLCAAVGPQSTAKHRKAPQSGAVQIGRGSHGAGATPPALAAAIAAVQDVLPSVSEADARSALAMVGGDVTAALDILFESGGANVSSMRATDPPPRAAASGAAAPVVRTSSGSFALPPPPLPPPVQPIAVGSQPS